MIRYKRIFLVNVSQHPSLFFFIFFKDRKKFYSLQFSTAIKNQIITIFFFIILFPSAGKPQRVVGFFFLPALPSPPPCEWFTWFIIIPLTTGRLPSQHLDPAIPNFFRFAPTFPTCPTVAEQFLDIKRTPPLR
ncbi:hypothetical protein Hdeb2414_s0009g00316191 [Helianthus debilis subsp. tardiflorus]